jgi:apolipoprotein N-acyltransferase
LNGIAADDKVQWKYPLASAVLYYLAFLTPLLTPNFIFLLPVLHRFEQSGETTTRERLKVGLAFGFFGSLLALHWIYSMAQISWVAWLLYVAMSLYFGAMMALALSIAGWIRERTGWTWGLILPAAWLPIEWVRTFGDLRMTADHVGHSLSSFPFVVQFADLTGLYGVGAFVLAMNGLLYDLVLADPARPRKKIAVVLATLVLVVAGYDTWAWRHYAGADRTIRVGVAQPNISLPEKWDPATNGMQWERLRLQTLEASEQGADLIVWPETGRPYRLFHRLEDPSTYSMPEVQALARYLNTPLLVGVEYYRVTDPENYDIYNAAMAVEADGRLNPVWTAKTFLVPFTEQTPFRSLFGRFVDNRSGAWRWLAGGFTPGPGATVLPFAEWNAGVVVCYEELFPSLSRDLQNAGADFQVVITNDAWFGRSQFQRYQVDALRMRSIENRTGYVRAANTGISGFYDRRGGVRQLTGLFESRVIVGDVPLSEGRTVYDRAGDWPVWLALAGLVLLVFRARRQTV